jgi:hypothetical protein
MIFSDQGRGRRTSNFKPAEEETFQNGVQTPDKVRELSPRRPGIYPALDQSDFARVVPARPRAEPFHAVPVRGLAGLASSFLPTVSCPSAVAFGSWFHILTSHRGLTPHKFTPMLGVHQAIEAIGDPGSPQPHG